MTKSKTDETLDRIIRSSFSTLIAELFTLPMCKIKTVYQNTDVKLIRNVALSIYKDSGISGFYNASVPAISSQIISTSMKYTLYHELKDNNYISCNIRLKNCIDGLISGIVTSIVTQPLEFLKIHKQMNSLINIRNVYQGYSKSLLKTAIGSTLFFPLYDLFKDISDDNKFVGGIVSSTISTIIMHPFDYLKTRAIYGLGSFPIHECFRGLSVNLLRIVPHFTIIVIISESFLKNYG